MPQKTALHSYFTSREILSYYCSIHGVGRHEAKERAQYLLETFGIPDKLDTHVNCMSEGQKRRLSLACAMIHHPKLLLL